MFIVLVVVLVVGYFVGTTSVNPTLNYNNNNNNVGYFSLVLLLVQ